MEPLRFLIADDHEIVRFGLRLLLHGEYPDAVVDEAADGAELLACVRANKYHIVIKDINMPNSDSLSAVRTILLNDPSTRILVLSMNPEGVYASTYLQEGCFGFIPKNESSAEVLKAVSLALSGQKYMSPSMVDTIVNSYQKAGKHSKNPFEKLSQRELQVVQYVLRGKTVSEISDLMCLHVSTIATHKTRAFDKLRISTIVELIELASLHKVTAAH